MPPTEQLTILFLAANPANTEPLKLDEEMRAIDQELRKTTYRDRFLLRSAWAVRYADLQDLLLRYQPHIVHFSGHGSSAGEIVLQDAAGKACPVAPAALAALFAILTDNVRCVVLNACFSAQQARGIARSIDCVVGMTVEVTDTAAIEFAAGFYLGLGYGRSLQTAFDLGRNRISLAGFAAEQRTPKLVVRRGVKLSDAALLEPLPAGGPPPPQPLPASTCPSVVSVGAATITGDTVQGDKITGNKVHIERVEAGAQIIVGDVHGAQAPAAIPAPPEPVRPPEAAGFVGRAAELAHYAEQLQATGLAVICGMAGVGKSALAAVLASRTAAPERIFWHSFHAEEGFRTVIWHLAGFLAHRGRDDLWRMLQSTAQTGSQSPPVELLFDYAFQLLRGQGYLLCLDDLQFVDEDPLFAEQVERLLGMLRAGELALIITSRRLPSFVTSAEDAALTGLGTADTGALLTARGVALPDDLVAGLHRQTGGNPQLLTLAAAAVHHRRDPARLLAHLTETDNIERYLLQEVDWGLSGDERSVLTAVAVLLGHPGTRAAVEAIAEVEGSLPRLMRGLSGRFLLIVQESEQGRAYGLHATLQTFYYDLLSTRERTALHMRAGDYYANVEPDALRAARHYQRGGDTARAAALATQDVWSVINQGQGQALLQLLDELDPTRLDARLNTQVALARGQVCAVLGDGEAAQKSFAGALQISAPAAAASDLCALRAQIYEAMGRLLEGDSPQQAMQYLERGLQELAGAGGQAEAALHIRIGSVQIAVGNYRAALAALQKGLALLPDKTSQLRASALLNIGIIYFDQGDTRQGTAYTLQALTISQELHDLFWVLAIQSNLGIYKETAGAWQEAGADYEEALALAGRLGSVVDQIRLENSLGTLYTKMGDDERAGAHLQRAVESARRHQDREDLAYGLASLADLKLRRRELDAAEPLLAEMEQLAAELTLDRLLAEADCLRAQLALARGCVQAALDHAARAVTRGRELGSSLEEGRYLRVLAEAQVAHEQHDQAITTLKQSLALLTDLDPYEAACTRQVLGHLLTAGGNTGQGDSLLREAAATLRKLGSRRELAQDD